MYVLKIHDKLFQTEAYWLRESPFASTRRYFYEEDIFNTPQEAYEHAIFLIRNDFVRKDIAINNFEVVWVDEVDPGIYKERES